MDDILKERIQGFVFRINKKYESVVNTSFLQRLIDDADSGEYAKRYRRLPNGIPVYVKYWKPRHALHRVKTIWHPTRIEVEGRQYPEFIKNELPVSDIVLWGSRSIPSRVGMFTSGMIVTKKIEGETLKKLYTLKTEPWVSGNHSKKFEVLGRIANLLYSIHEKKLVHGDYKLKNIMYTPEKPKGRYWVIDLASGWSLSQNESLNVSHLCRELCRMAYSLTKTGFSRSDILYFFESYVRCRNDKSDSSILAQKYLDVCFKRCSKTRDHKSRTKRDIPEKNSISQILFCFCKTLNRSTVPQPR
jgi:tRNA A-37 threonylcarbamoyl transferase component Bud32